MVFDIVDKRGRAFVSLKPSHIQILSTIEKSTGMSEEEIFRDALKFFYSDMVRSGVISFNTASKNTDANSIEDAQFLRNVSIVKDLVSEMFQIDNMKQPGE